MSEDVDLACRCGSIRGRLRGASPGTVNRLICYCDDCQAFLHHLGRADLLDPRGGSDIVQVAPARVTFDEGAERIAGLRLSAKGLYRFYASCCKTPLGNTFSPAVPFVGFLPEVFAGSLSELRRDAVLGKSRGHSGGKNAVGEPALGSATLGMVAHAVRLVLSWKVTGQAWPHPFFDRATKLPNRQMEILSSDAREALRPLCGPGRPGVV